MFVECVNPRIAIFGQYKLLFEEACLSCDKESTPSKRNLKFS